MAARRCWTPWRRRGLDPGVSIARLASLGISRPMARSFFQRLRRTKLHAVEKSADVALVRGDHSFKHRAARPWTTGDQHLLKYRWSGGHHMRLPAKALEKWLPVPNTVILYTDQINVGGGTEQAVLQVLTKTIVDGESDHQRGNPGSDPSYGNTGDDADHGLPAFRPEISRSDKKFETHGVNKLYG